MGCSVLFIQKINSVREVSCSLPLTSDIRNSDVFHTWLCTCYGLEQVFWKAEQELMEGEVASCQINCSQRLNNRGRIKIDEFES